MTCHNTRNGRITWDAADAGRYTGPHEAAQMDVIVGKNTFFLNDTVDRSSPHMNFVGDSCVTCHKDLGEAGHSFAPAENVCMKCHGPAFQIDFVQKPTEALLNQTRAAIEKRFLAGRSRIGVILSFNPETGQSTQNFPVDGNTITSLDEIITSGGQITFGFKLANGQKLYSRLGEMRDAPNGTRAFATNDPIVRASWNYLLIEFDGSEGVHNPKFTRELLTTTIDALK
jgi:hypothetical protein